MNPTPTNNKKGSINTDHQLVKSRTWNSNIINKRKNWDNSKPLKQSKLTLDILDSGQITPKISSQSSKSVTQKNGSLSQRNSTSFSSNPPKRLSINSINITNQEQSPPNLMKKRYSEGSIKLQSPTKFSSASVKLQIPLINICNTNESEANQRLDTNGLEACDINICNTNESEANQRVDTNGLEACDINICNNENEENQRPDTDRLKACDSIRILTKSHSEKILSPNFKQHQILFPPSYGRIRITEGSETSSTTESPENIDTLTNVNSLEQYNSNEKGQVIQPNQSNQIIKSDQLNQPREELGLLEDINQVLSLLNLYSNPTTIFSYMFMDAFNKFQHYQKKS